MKEKNPWIGGLLNLLIPGLGRFYAGDRAGCVVTLLTFPLVLAVCAYFPVLLVDFLRVSDYPGDIPQLSTLQGLAGIVIVLFWLALFPSGYFFVKRYNKKLATSVPEPGRPTEQEHPETKLKKLQEMLSAGLITQEDYESKKADILSKM